MPDYLFTDPGGPNFLGKTGAAAANLANTSGNKVKKHWKGATILLMGAMAGVGLLGDTVTHTSHNISSTLGTVYDKNIKGHLPSINFGGDNETAVTAAPSVGVVGNGEVDNGAVIGAGPQTPAVSTEGLTILVEAGDSGYELGRKCLAAAGMTVTDQAAALEWAHMQEINGISVAHPGDKPAC